MFVFLLQVRHAVVEGGPLYLFAVFSAIVWALWVVKVVLSRRYEPWREPYETTTSVLVPVVDEPVDLFRDVLRRIVAQRPTETIVVINGARNHALEEVCAEFARRRRDVDVDADPEQAQCGQGGNGARERRDPGARRLRHGLDSRHAVRAGQALRRSRDRRGHHTSTGPRPAAALLHAVGRLAGEQPRQVFDAGSIRARARRLPARSHDCFSTPDRRPRRWTSSCTAGFWVSSSRSPTTAR